MNKDNNNDAGKTSDNDSLNMNIVPFDTVEEAWFWFVLAQQAKVDGARFTAGMSLTPRPCEPSDILSILNRLYRNRMLLWDHILVLRHYGRRKLAPDPTRAKEARAHKLWGEAMERLEPIFIRRGILNEKKSNKSWVQEAMVYSNTSNDEAGKTIAP